MGDPMVDQDLAALHEDIKTLRYEVTALRWQITLTRWLLIGWVAVSLVLMVALVLMIEGANV